MLHVASEMDARAVIYIHAHNDRKNRQKNKIKKIKGGGEGGVLLIISATSVSGKKWTL